MKDKHTGMAFLNLYAKAIKDTCKDCKWSDNNCICVVCEDGQFALCTLKHKHVDKYNVCENFEKEDKE
jgi:hypothetical protein